MSKIMEFLKTDTGIGVIALSILALVILGGAVLLVENSIKDAKNYCNSIDSELADHDMYGSGKFECTNGKRYARPICAIYEKCTKINKWGTCKSHTSYEKCNAQLLGSVKE